MKEIRITEIRAGEPAGTSEDLYILSGRPIVFDQPTTIYDGEGGSFTEVIARGALDNADLSDIRLIYNHNTDRVPLARTPKTMQISVDSEGMTFAASLPKTASAMEVYEAVKRGDLDKMSFAFTVPDGGDEYDVRTNTRTVTKINKVYECSIVPYPAYPQTSVQARILIKSEALRQKANDIITEIRTGDINMKFNSVAEAFNQYKYTSASELEQRAGAIQVEMDTNKDADLDSLFNELKGIREAIANQRENKRSAGDALNLITGRSFDDSQQGKVFTADNVVSSEEYRSAFYKTLLGHSLNEGEKAAYKAYTELRASEYSTSTDVALAIPTATLNEILKKARTMGGLLAEARAFTMPSKISIPIGTPANKAEWHVEGAAVDTNKVVIDAVTFDGNEIIKIFSISAKSKLMTISAFEAYLTDELTACVMETIADSLINGSGSGQGTGLETGITWSTSGASKNHVQIASSGKWDYAKTVEAVALLKRGYSMGAKWAMNNATLYNVFYGMTDTNGRPIFIADPKNESIGKILGFDVVIDDNIADNVAYLGNYSKYLGYNMPAGIAIEVSRDSSFKSGLIDYRALAIADTKPLIGEAFVKISKASA